MPEPSAVNALFSRIARRYDLANRVLSGGVDRLWRARLVAQVRAASPGSVLDVATGSGDVALALARGLPEGVALTGVDFCEPMLACARAKQASAREPAAKAIRFVTGDALALPFPVESFDTITISFGLRNMGDRARCLGELGRVLRPGGSLFILEFSQPDAWARPFYYAYLWTVAPLVAGALTGDRSAYRYLGQTIRGFPDRACLSTELLMAGYESVSAAPMTFGVVALHSGRKPGAKPEPPGSPSVGGSPDRRV